MLILFCGFFLELERSDGLEDELFLRVRKNILNLSMINEEEVGLDFIWDILILKNKRYGGKDFFWMKFLLFFKKLLLRS